MKIASISNAINTFNKNNIPDRVIEHVIVHTGQHYDSKMSTMFFVELGIPVPDVNLEVGSGSHAVQTSEIMRRFEPILLEHVPDVLLVVGDVNSTIACALVASKIEYPKKQDKKRPVIVHVEAGLRSFDMEMPEEINRILTDSISDILFTTEAAGNENLIHAGIAEEKVHFVGNVMIDTLLTHRERASHSLILTALQILPQRYVVVTLHRPSNVDDQATFRGIMTALNEVAQNLPVIFPVHPRTKQRLAEWRIPCSDSIR
ncbi:MAG: UDP-N-acetyl glucosamine 2-epimerase, partial [Chlorobium sp.]|nr:UDP-N-acetyl glucosamine 2-epimerase [Chlorobium sp.]